MNGIPVQIYAARHCRTVHVETMRSLFQDSGLYVETGCGSGPHALRLVHRATVVPQRGETCHADFGGYPTDMVRTHTERTEPTRKSHKLDTCHGTRNRTLCELFTITARQCVPINIKGAQHARRITALFSRARGGSFRGTAEVIGVVGLCDAS